ncbi:YhcH/YjgK/YiaL family protein [Youxingia wuxianensis]|uniref:YhcH/YjgK/YiaL family protein n=1 Tax=Youxingia wuxianensis TaxID=2763678 RepID=A0A926EL06_9FIRM|nr:YhcH/YjgK/YiaL family protein [Youxingia wuxianensis]MBC8584315.1 YhcH/YjgK/YiaL family protein [Youxingia wuxianensis]
MYGTRIELAKKYNYLDEKFQTAYEFLSRKDLDQLEIGTIPLCEGVYAMVQEYHSVPAHTARFETHDDHFDVQYVLSGQEYFGLARREGLVSDGEKDQENDVVFYKEPTISGGVVLLPGDFIVVAPEDAHKPRCSVGDGCVVRKIVVKIKL